MISMKTKMYEALRKHYDKYLFAPSAIVLTPEQYHQLNAEMSYMEMSPTIEDGMLIEKFRGIKILLTDEVVVVI